MPHVSVKPEQIATLLGLSVTNSLVTSLIVSVLFILLMFYYSAQSKKPNSKRGGLYYLLNGILKQAYNLFHSVTEDKIKYLFPLLGTFFMFILLQNWFGLLPGVGSVLVKAPHVEEKYEETELKGAEKLDTVQKEVKEAKQADDHGASENEPATPEDEDHAPATAAAKTEEHPPTATEEHVEEAHYIPLFRGGTADLNLTLALGIIAVVAIQYFGVRFLGLKTYVGKFFNFKGPIDFFIGILEIVSELSRAFSFSFRLFGNIIAGEILLVIIATLVPVLISFPFLVMEIFVGLIQAVVFSTLAAIFIKMAVTEHH